MGLAASGNGLRKTPAPLAKLRSEELEWQLIVTLYSQTPPLVMAGIGLAIVGIFGWCDTHQTWFLFWAAAAMAILTGRLLLSRAFNRRRETADRVEVWRKRFFIAAWAMGIHWSCAALAVIYDTPPLLQLVVLSTVLVIVMGGAARNAGCPKAAASQAMIALLPIFVACAATSDRYHLVFCVVVTFVLLAAFTLVQQLNRRLVELLQLNDENGALVSEILRANAELSAAATTDTLTGIPNRRHFDATLLDEAARARRERSELSLFLIDIDSFKEYNDIYGHQAGDECLLRVARAFVAELRRPGDLVARYGGEEFVAVLAQTDAVAAARQADAVRAGVEALGIRHAAGLGGVVTVSIGVSTFPANHPHHRPDSLLRAADIALYAAKHAGRNCVRAAPSSPFAVELGLGVTP